MAFILSLAALLIAPSSRSADLLIFITSDCPVSNYYATEIQDLCATNRPKGLTCTLVYEDAGLDEAQMRAHLEEYRYRVSGHLNPTTPEAKSPTAVIDRDRAIARRAGATVTPQAVLFSANGRIEYRGRIDNRYEALGKPRRVVTRHDLRDAVDAVLSGRPVPTSETPALGCFITPASAERNAP
jgi:hypothetical protein